MNKIKLMGYGGARMVFLDGQLITPDQSMALVKHTHEGFNWGYSGEQPAQLALAILLQVLSTEGALKHYRTFEKMLISQLPQKDFHVEVSFDKNLENLGVKELPTAGMYEKIPAYGGRRIL
jgi:hypothetical protein